MTINELEKSEKSQKDKIKKVPPEELDTLSGGTGTAKNLAQDRTSKALEQSQKISKNLNEMQSDIIEKLR